MALALLLLCVFLLPLQGHLLRMNDGIPLSQDWQFVHIPKTGGTSVESLLRSSGVTPAIDIMFPALRNNTYRSKCGTAETPWHYTPNQVENCQWEPNPYTGRNTWCVIRHPVMRFLSEFKWRLNRIQTEGWEGSWTQFLPRNFGVVETNSTKRFDIVQFAKDTTSLLTKFSKSCLGNTSCPLTENFLHLQPQHWYVDNEKGNMTCDKVLPFRTLVTQLPEKLNVGARINADYRPDIAQIRNILWPVYKEDFALFFSVTKSRQKNLRIADGAKLSGLRAEVR
uniref:Sulfotransferase n=1 Tax=Tetraselmis sp. GSL018 TaxID=582737 RepID=A0A061S7A0_9CHLO|mmetsp:Transcript_828/g.1995  ORF Transcript_828/g.1995 Transcript_828/m.1995 type:complete len:281 (-) Transcript_828:212-1054(-)|eukprot:CAMPEP_0177601546 /NCGR_PEP_ID=MMETSP0419_2-20121207/14325_1 /TAXON_ID=582737 /ORGANISM="Tetraselmis sp., Strain GSL018" /LENGTH=280 /DNA_ID=CAMNT_0019094835 /DNA_START=42 /DNA_END=884 /DNA_ORIENTATION=-